MESKLFRYILTPGSRQLSQKKNESNHWANIICYQKQLCFLRHGWILQNLDVKLWTNFKPLYEATKEQDTKLIIWWKDHDQAFNKIRQALVEASEVNPNLNKPFYVYIEEKQRIALGVCVQQIGKQASTGCKFL